MQGLWPINTIERGERIDLGPSGEEVYDLDMNDPF